MTAPDAREWHRIDPEAPAAAQVHEAAEQFSTAHPDIVLGRFTILGIERNEPWLCIDGWIKRPDDQGPEPTDADIPMAGFW